MYINFFFQIVPSVNVPTSESIIIFQKSQKNIGHVRCNAYNSVGNYSVTAAALSFPNEKGIFIPVVSFYPIFSNNHFLQCYNN